MPKTRFRRACVATFLRGTMPFFEPEQPFYTYSIDIATLWGGLWYLFFEIQHAEHGQMCLSGAFVWQRVRTRSEFLHAACSSYKCRQQIKRRGILGYSLRSCRQSRAHAQTRSRSKAPAFALTRASDAANMHPAPSDHNMRWATTALRTVCRTLGPQLSVDVEVLRALSGPARRNG